jgi:hypothetical protein
MEERQLLSKRRSHVSWRPKLPGQIGFGPTHTGPAAQECQGGGIPSGTDMKHAPEQRHRHEPRSRCPLSTGQNLDGAPHYTVPCSAMDADAGWKEPLVHHSPQPKKVRLESLDVFRGLTVAWMVLVDMLGASFPLVDHRYGVALVVALADFVMPNFDFMVGVSIAFVLSKSMERCSTCRFCHAQF